MNEVLYGARATQTLVGREKALTQIYQTICEAGTEFRLVLFTAQGGFGKTRLLQEVLWHCGLPADEDFRPPATGADDWNESGKVRIASLLDFVNTRLHNRTDFIQAARDAFSRPTDSPFSTYDFRYADLRKKLNAMESYPLVHEARTAAEQAFDEDYDQLNSPAEGQRLVWVLDTVEYLVAYFKGRLAKYDLLTPEDLAVHTEGWLLDFIERRPPNTTILLAGRGDEGAEFFDHLRGLFADNDPQLVEVQVEKFDSETTRCYLEAMRDDWPDDPVYENAKIYLKELLDSSDVNERVATLHIYTDGLPIRLALYTDLLIESAHEPEPLQDTLAQAEDRIGREGLETVQFEVEAKFLDLLFDNPDSLRVQILFYLVRARRGLTPRELHFVLDSQPDEDPDSWQENENRVIEISEAIASLRHLSFVKRAPDGRLTLQDEFYRIYDEHMLRADQAGETRRRHTLYSKLSFLAKSDITKKRRELQEWRRKRLAMLRWDSPSNALEIKYRPMDELETEKFHQLREEIRSLMLTELYYDLLRNPRQGLNEISRDLREQWNLAADEVSDTLIQVEIRRAIFDKNSRKFIDLKRRGIERERGENAWEVIERVVEQRDAAIWIARFFWRREYQRAIDLAETLEKKSEEWGRAWQHTYTRSQQTVWKSAARIYLGQVNEGIGELESTIQHLCRLLTPEGIPERNEESFRPSQGPTHPAADLLESVLGSAYNFVGYGYTVQGQFRQAVKHYTQALSHFRAAKARASASQTQTNLARALSELGRPHRAELVCRDALAIREELGDSSPIAITHNTLALIANDALQPEKAWEEAVKALIEFRQLGQARGIGLALIQLGEALRRLAVAPSAPEPANALQDASEAALLEARNIFSKDPHASRETLRLIEAELELGCLYRDRVKFTSLELSQRREQRGSNALSHLQAAINLAEELNNHRLKLDSQVNIGWLYYFWDKPEQASQALSGALEWVPADYRLRPGQPLPNPSQLPEVFYLQQLSKIHALYGRLAMEHARTHINKLTLEHPDWSKAEITADEQTREYFKQAAEAFVMAAAYAQLYSPRAAPVSLAFNALYEYLQSFNTTEMKAFYNLVRKEQEKYGFASLKPENLADVEQFLRECFGEF